MKVTKEFTVINEQNIGLMGVNIIDNGNGNNGAITDYGGNASISVELYNSITLSYMGYKTKVLNFSDLPSEIILKEDIHDLGEVYVGTVKNKDNYYWILVLGLIVSIASYFKK